jgi:hypothetical protein
VQASSDRSEISFWKHSPLFGFVSSTENNRPLQKVVNTRGTHITHTFMQQREKERARVANQSQLTGRLARSLGKKNKMMALEPWTSINLSLTFVTSNSQNNYRNIQILNPTPKFKGRKILHSNFKFLVFPKFILNFSWNEILLWAF